MPGAVVLGNAGRALINSGPPRTGHWFWQLTVVLFVLVVIWMIWSLFGGLNRRGQSWRGSRGYILADALTNPILVKVYSLVTADVLAFFYYYWFFSSASWNGLVAVSWGASFAMAAGELHRWAEHRWGAKEGEK